MPSASRSPRAVVLVTGLCFAVLSAIAFAQQGPVAAMFADDQKRDAALAPSFATVDQPATQAAAFPLKVYLSAGDLERAFDRSEFRPDAAVVPTNTELVLDASAPATQRVLIQRVEKVPEVMRDLEEQVAGRRKQATPPSGTDPGPLRVGVDSFVVQLSRGGGEAQSQRAFPKSVCLVATDFPKGGAVERRALFAQDRVRKGIAACLEALDAAGVSSVVLPQMGAASSTVQQNDPRFEGQRALRECRLINSTAGIALGIHDFAPRRRGLREIGLIQWDQEINGMFKVPAGSRAERSAQAAYRAYAEQITLAFQHGLAGQKTTSADVAGNCGAILDIK
ncbi:MAG TPA: hypothetical protein VH417_19480 [Vicinamibacterales bacterium]